MTNIVFIILLSITLLIGVILPLYRETRRTNQYKNLLKAIKDEKCFYYKKDNTGIYCLIKNIDNSKEESIYLNLEIIYPDNSRESFYTSYDVFKDTWE
jgi:hypothetical protein